MDEGSRRVDRPATGVTHARQHAGETLIKIGTAGGRSLVRARLGWKWANLTVRALSIALPDLSVDTVLATYPHSDPH